MPLNSGEITGVYAFENQEWIFLLLSLDERTAIWFRWGDVIPPLDRSGEYRLRSGAEPFKMTHRAIQQGEPILFHPAHVSEEILATLRSAALITGDSINTTRSRTRH